MPRLVIRGHRLLTANEHLFALRAHQDLVAGVVEVGGIDGVLVVARRPQGGLVDEVADVGPGQPHRAAGEPVEIDVGREGDFSRMNAKQRQPGFVVGAVDGDVAVEATGAEKGGVEDVGPVRGAEHDHRLRRAEAIHLGEDLVEGLLTLVVAAAEPRATVATDGVDLVDEQDRRRGVLGGLEEVANARRADADEHLDELAAGNGEERDPRLAGDGPGEERFAGARRAHQQYPLRHAAPEALKAARVFEEVDDFLEILLHLLEAGDIGKRHLPIAGTVAFGGRLAESSEKPRTAERVAGAPQGDPEAGHEEEGNEHIEAEEEAGAVGWLADGRLHLVLQEHLAEPLTEVGGDLDLEGARRSSADLAGAGFRGLALELPLEGVAGDPHLGDIPGLHLPDELIPGDGGDAAGLFADHDRHQGERGQRQHDDRRHAEGPAPTRIRLGESVVVGAPLNGDFGIGTVVAGGRVHRRFRRDTVGGCLVGKPFNVV